MRVFFRVIIIFALLCTSCWNKNKNTVSGTDKLVDNNTPVDNNIPIVKNIVLSDLNWKNIDIDKINTNGGYWCVAYGDNKWVAVGYRLAAYSSDGKNWVADNNIAFSDIRAVAYGDKNWVKVGTDRSYDGRIGYARDK